MCIYRTISLPLAFIIKLIFVKTNLFALLLLVGFSISLSAQSFVRPVNAFSHKKTSYITLENGKEVKGTIKDLDWKKGLIEEVKIMDQNGKKIKIKPEEIKHMYLMPTALSKATGVLSAAYDATKWTNEELNNEQLSQGYVYLEKSDVRIKKKTRTLMVQLLNPQFSDKIKVYHDPISGETMGASVGGIKVTETLPKSFFIKKPGETVAFEVKKKNYSDEFARLFNDCPELTKKYGKAKWMEIEDHMYEYGQLCGGK